MGMLALLLSVIQAVSLLTVLGTCMSPIIPVTELGKIQGGFVSTLAGSGVAGYANGVGTSASFNAPFGIAFNPVVWQFPLTGQFMWLIKVTTGFAVSAQRER